MKQKNLYYILVACLVIISILLTMIVMSNQNNPNIQNNPNHPNHPNYPNKYYNTIHNMYDRDIDYAYDYNGNWFQPSIWWNSLWYPNRRHMYDRRNMYDRRDGLKIENRYNFIQNQPTLHDITLTEKKNTEKPNVNELQSQSQSQHKIELVKPQPGSLFPLPTLTSIFSSSSSSTPSPMMPEEIAISPMSKMHIENSIHSISAFTDSVPINTNNYNFDYKGADSKNQKPLPVDMMASESIYLQPNTVANEIIKPNIAMEHPNPM